MKKVEPLVQDGVGKYMGICKLCGRNDLIFPLSGNIFLCPRCLRKTALSWNDVLIVKSGFCDLCGVHFLGAGVAVKSSVMACFRCLWVKLGKRRDALRPEGTRIL